jgi:hypothetical protein
MTFNGRDAGMSRQINAVLYVIDKKGNEIVYNPKVGILPKFMTSWQTGQDNLKLDKKQISFGKIPVLKIIDDGYGNPKEDIELSSVYKYSKSELDFVSSKDFKAPLC